MMIMTNILSSSRFRLILSHILELLIIAIILFILGFMPSLISFEKRHLFDEFDISCSAAFAFIIFFLIGFLILSRVIRSKGWFLLLSDLWFLALCGFYFYKKVYPDLYDIKMDTVPGFIQPGFLVPTVVSILIRELLHWVIPLLCGIYFVRRSFHHVKFAAGVIVSAFILMYLFYWKIPAGELFITFVFCEMMIRLPLQRQALERLFGFPLQPSQPQRETSRPSFAVALLAHTNLLVIFILTAFFVLFGSYERRMFRIFGSLQPVTIHRSPALVNTYDYLKVLFVKKLSPEIKSSLSSLSPDYTLMISQSTPPELFEDAMKKIDQKSLDEGFKTMEPYIKAYEKASGADYCVYNDPNTPAIPHFANIRLTSRAIALRAMIAMHNNQPKESLKDIETIANFGWVLGTDGFLVQYMVGLATRKIAVDVAYNYYLRYRNDPESLNLLADSLKRMSPRFHSSFDVETVKRNEPGLWQVAPYFEFITPGMKRAYINFYSAWVQFDQLVLAVALEQYHKDHGVYPEKLESLTPQYLESLPREPYEGKPYLYEKERREFTIHCPYYNTEGMKKYMYKKDMKVASLELYFPASKADNPELRKQIQSQNKPVK